ncbi:MAG TPA: 30S ribosome-binding factor RbfA [Planctomycetota bacterium]|nr:30S ribosome-binding factor RbfA [Planctomycetota bacterium]
MANPRTKARIEARIHERAAHLLEFEIADPRSTFITITRVELASDLSAGKIFYSVLGGPGERSKAAHMLESAAGWLQRQIGRSLDLRRVPHLTWHYDEGIERAARVDAAIRQALERDRAIQEHGTAPPEEDPADWEKEYEEFAGEEKDLPPEPPAGK